MDYAFYVHRERSLDEILPWGFHQCRCDKGILIKRIQTGT